jgi:hypothetical protein
MALFSVSLFKFLSKPNNWRARLRASLSADRAAPSYLTSNLETIDPNSVAQNHHHLNEGTLRRRDRSQLFAQ